MNSVFYIQKLGLRWDRAGFSLPEVEVSGCKILTDVSPRIRYFLTV